MPTLLNNKLSLSADYFNNIRSQILITEKCICSKLQQVLHFLLKISGKLKTPVLKELSVITIRRATLDMAYHLTEAIQRTKSCSGMKHPVFLIISNQQEDQWVHALYYNAIGIFKDQAAIDAYPHWAGAVPGDVIFEDVNNDGKIDGLDRVMNEYNNLPRFIYGFTVDLKYKGFDLTMLIQGATGARFTLVLNQVKSVTITKNMLLTAGPLRIQILLIQEHGTAMKNTGEVRVILSGCRI